MSHCMFVEDGCSASECSCPCSPCKRIRVMAAAEEKAGTQSRCLFHVWVREGGDEVLTSAPPKVWCKCRLCGARSPLLYYEDPVRDELRKRVAALEGGIVAENRRAVSEHNALKGRLKEMVEAATEYLMRSVPDPNVNVEDRLRDALEKERGL